MVRTYKFNPSMQSSDYMPGSRPIANHPSMQSSNYMPLPKTPYQPVNSFIANHPSMTPPPQQLMKSEDDCPFSRYYKPPSNHNQHPPKPTNKVFEDETTIFGIRSVVIDGQRFYQPLDQQLNKELNEQFVSLKPSLNSEISKHNDPVSAAIMAFVEPPQDPIIRQNSNHHFQDTIIKQKSRASINDGQFQDEFGPNEKFHRQFKEEFIPKNDNRFREEFIPRNDNRFKEEFGPKLELGINHRDEKMIDELPWARGNPQPKSGIRGSLGWSFGQRTNPFVASPPVDPLYKTYNKGWLNDSLQFAPKPPSKNIYQTASQEAYSYLDAPKPISYPANLASSYTSFNSEPLANHINPYTYGASAQESKRYEQEQHRLDLLRQIEDNNRRKMMDKQREWDEEQRERWRSERTIHRQREEVQREQDEVRQRQMAAEMKAQNATFDSHKNGNRNRQSRSSPRSTPKQQEGRRQSSTPKNQLEWWEKKPSWQDRQISSPAIPSIRTSNQQQTSLPSRQSREESLSGYSVSRQNRRSNSIEQQMEVVDRPVSLQSRQSRSQSRNSRRSYQPSLVSRADSNTTGLRNLSATRRRLEDEYDKVRSAVDKNQYDCRVFDP